MYPIVWSSRTCQGNRLLCLNSDHFVDTVAEVRRHVFKKVQLAKSIPLVTRNFRVTGAHLTNERLLNRKLRYCFTEVIFCSNKRSVPPPLPMSVCSMPRQKAKHSPPTKRTQMLRIRSVRLVGRKFMKPSAKSLCEQGEQSVGARLPAPRSRATHMSSPTAAQSRQSSRLSPMPPMYTWTTRMKSPTRKRILN